MNKLAVVMLTAVFSASMAFASDKVVPEVKIGKTWTRIANADADGLGMPKSVTVDTLRFFEKNVDEVTKKVFVELKGQPFNGEYQLNIETRKGKLYGEIVLFSRYEGGSCVPSQNGVVALYIPLNTNSGKQILSLGADVDMVMGVSSTWDACHGEWTSVDLLKK